MPESLGFQHVGVVTWVLADGEFADAKRVSLERSSYTTYVSDNPAVATVTAGGQVKAVGPGSARITIGCKGLSVVVPVTVEKP